MREILSNDRSSVLRLLRTPRPQSDESLMGYILRLTEENAYNAPSWIFELADMRVSIPTGGWATLYRSDFDYTLLRKIIGLEQSEFEYIRYRGAEFESSIVISNRSVPISCIKFSSPKICPGCLKQANYYRSAWDVMPLTACPTHRTMLIDICPKCNKRISWVRRKVSICLCGFDWRDFVQDELAQQELEVPQLIHNHYALSVGDAPFNRGKNNPLFKLDLELLCKTLSFIADYYYSTKVGRRLTVNTENLICHEMYAYSFSVFTDWPESFYTFLSWAEQKKGMTWDVHELHRQVCKLCNKSSLSFIAVAFEDYIENYCEMSFRFPLISKRFIDKEKACERLGTNEKWLEVLISQGKLELFHGGENDLVDTESIFKLEDRLDSLMSIWTVVLVLNIDKVGVEELVSEVCLKPFSGPTVDGLQEWKFEDNEVDGLIERIKSKVSKCASRESKDLVDGKKVFDVLRKYKLSLGCFISRVLDNEITPQKLLPQRGFAQFAFHRQSVIKYIKNLYEQRGFIRTFSEAARFLDRKRWVNDRIYTNKGISTYNILELIHAAKPKCSTKGSQ